MTIRCIATHVHLMLATSRSAGFRQKTLSETLSSPLESRPTPWFSSWSSHKRTTHLFCWPLCSREILTRCAGRQSPTSPCGGSSSWNHRKLFRGSALWNNWASMRSHVCPVESQQLKDWKLATWMMGRLNWVACILLIHLLGAVGILRSNL